MFKSKSKLKIFISSFLVLSTSLVLSGCSSDSESESADKYLVDPSDGSDNSEESANYKSDAELNAALKDAGLEIPIGLKASALEVGSKLCFDNYEWESCLDSDGGSEPSQRGLLKAINAEGVDFSEDFRDANNGPNSVREYICEDNIPCMETIECSNGLLDGACAPTEEELVAAKQESEQQQADTEGEAEKDVDSEVNPQNNNTPSKNASKNSQPKSQDVVVINQDEPQDKQEEETLESNLSADLIENVKKTSKNSVEFGEVVLFYLNKPVGPVASCQYICETREGIFKAKSGTAKCTAAWDQYERDLDCEVKTEAELICTCQGLRAKEDQDINTQSPTPTRPQNSARDRESIEKNPSNQPSVGQQEAVNTPNKPSSVDQVNDQARPSPTGQLINEDSVVNPEAAPATTLENQDADNTENLQPVN
jgi:hypothetical protein